MAASNCRTRGNNLRNAVVSLLAPLPSILFYLFFLRRYYTADADFVSPLWSWCYHHPFLLANALFFLNVNCLFWVVGLLQSSHWFNFERQHDPSFSRIQWLEIKISDVFTWVWAVRLTHSYFRRERWQWGTREDWRFNDMRRQHGRNWWWISFFAVYVSQQVLLMGICLPLYVVHSKDGQFNIWDVAAAIVCLTGVIIAYFADTQLHNFVTRNERLKHLGQELVLTLDEGTWHYSRHPNYFGEQLWWWGLAIFAGNLDCKWSYVGALINSLSLAYVTVLVEEHMLKRDDRAVAYKIYQKKTSVWIPWFKKQKDT